MFLPFFSLPDFSPQEKKKLLVLRHCDLRHCEMLMPVTLLTVAVRVVVKVVVKFDTRLPRDRVEDLQEDTAEGIPPSNFPSESRSARDTLGAITGRLSGLERNCFPLPGACLIFCSKGVKCY